MAREYLLIINILQEYWKITVLFFAPLEEIKDKKLPSNTGLFRFI